MNFTHDELLMIAIYESDSRKATIEKIREMLPYLGEEEKRLRTLALEAIAKLEKISDNEFKELELFPEDGEQLRERTGIDR